MTEPTIRIPAATMAAAIVERFIEGGLLAIEPLVGPFVAELHHELEQRDTDLREGDIILMQGCFFRLGRWVDAAGDAADG